MAYVMTAEENYDAAHISYITALTNYAGVEIWTDQNYQGIQWDPVRRNLMYMYTELTPDTPGTNTTGFHLWDGETHIAPAGLMDREIQFNSSVCVKNIDTGAVAFHLNYDSDNLVPNGIGGSDGTYRRFTRDFYTAGIARSSGEGNGPGMTDPYTGNFWINSSSCPLYCFRLEDSYSQTISPLFPTGAGSNNMQIVGFTNTGATSPWSFTRELGKGGSPDTALLHLVPRLYTAEEITADYLLIYATFTYPRSGVGRIYHAYNREVFDHAGNMYVLSCVPEGGKDFKLYKFSPPTSANYPAAAVGGGFTDITPWASGTGPNADAADYTLERPPPSLISTPQRETSDVIPLYLPATDDLVLIEKFFPTEHTADSSDPALMSWSCTYVNDPSGTPTWDHHTAFVTGYMTSAWAPTDIDGAAYAVVDAFEVNNYLGQSDFLYDIDYTKRWFFFLCTKMTDGVSDGKPRIVLVEYSFVYGSAPSVVQVVDEQGWDDAYPAYAPKTNDAYPPYDPVDTPAVAVSMMTVFDNDFHYPLWDVGIYDPDTETFWWSGGSTDRLQNTALFCQFDPIFSDRMQTDFGIPGGTAIAATPPFMTLIFSDSGGGGGGGDSESRRLRVWGYSLDDHNKYVLRVGESETFIYDLSTGQWAQFSSPDRDNWRAHVGQNWIGMSVTTFAHGFGTDIVAGDDTENVLWILDPTYGKDDRPTTGSDPFTRIVTGGLSVSGRNTIPCGAVQLTCSVGAPIQDGATIVLETSDDFGHTWLNHGAVSLTTDDFGSIVEWRALGLITQPGRVFRITDTGATVRIAAADMR